MLRLRKRSHVMNAVGMAALYKRPAGTLVVEFQWKNGPVIRGVHCDEDNLRLTAPIRSQTSTLRDREISVAVNRLLDHGIAFYAVSNTMQGPENTIIIYWSVVKD